MRHLIQQLTRTIPRKIPQAHNITAAQQYLLMAPLVYDVTPNHRTQHDVITGACAYDIRRRITVALRRKSLLIL